MAGRDELPRIPLRGRAAGTGAVNGGAESQASGAVGRVRECDTGRFLGRGRPCLRNMGRCRTGRYRCCGILRGVPARTVIIGRQHLCLRVRVL